MHLSNIDLAYCVLGTVLGLGVKKLIEITAIALRAVMVFLDWSGVLRY